MNASILNHAEPSTAAKAGRSGQRVEQPSDERRAHINSPWILFLLSMVAILPFWTVRYPVVTDYPNHLARWFVLFHMKDGAYHFANMYAPAWGPLPYISPDVLAMALQYILPIDIVGRLILSLCVILPACATYFFLKEACPENVGLACFGIFLALNPNLQMGSISNEFSLAFCLMVVALWVRFCKAPKIATAVAVSAGLLLVYLSHLSGFVVAGLAMGVYALFQERRWKKIGILAALSLPGLLIYLGDPSHGGGSNSFKYGNIVDKLKDLTFPLRLHTSKVSDIAVIAVLVVLVFFALKSRSKYAWQPVWLAVSIACLLVYMLAPGSYGYGGYVATRFLPFVYLFALAAIRFDRVPRYLPIGLALLVLFRVATWEQVFISQQRELAQLTEAFDAIPSGARVLPLTKGPNSGIIGTGGLHHLEYGVIQRGFLDPQLFHLQGVQPVRLVGSPYCVDVFCDVAGAPHINWQQIVNSYDYLWVYNDPEVKSSASRIADEVLSNDFVAIYRVRHSQL
jgi:hypothetical protein